MITSPNMGLKIWNLQSDPYNSSQLAENFAKIENHDHSNGRGVQINGSSGIVDASITSAKLAAGLQATPLDGSVTTPKIVDGAVTVAKLAAEAAPQFLLGATNGTTVVPPTTVTDLSIGLLENSTGLSLSSGQAVTAAGGVYAIMGTVDFIALSTETYKYVAINAVGSGGIVATTLTPGGSIGSSRISVATTVRLAAGANVKLQVEHNGPANKNVEVYRFAICRVAV